MKTKKLLIFTLAIFIVFGFVLLGVMISRNINAKRNFSKPRDFNSSFWVGEDVIDGQFKGYDAMPGTIGAIKYLDKAYKPVLDDAGIYVLPDKYISYIVELDKNNKDSYVNYLKEIDITDPSVKVFGFTINSSSKKFGSYFESIGFKKVSDNERGVKLVRDNITVALSLGKEIIIVCDRNK